MKKILLLPIMLAAFGCLALLVPNILANPMNPTFDTFGTLGVATFGGSGIPNTDVAITNYAIPGGGTTVLGLTATPRFADPPLTNNGAGVFTATAGGDGANGKPNYAMWNIDFYVSGIAAGDTVKFFYDTDPTVGNNVTNFINFFNGNGQDSWNLGMSFLGGSGFDPNAAGQYNFGLQLYDSAGAVLDTAALSVNVNGLAAIPDYASTLGLLALSLGAIAFFGRRERKKIIGPPASLVAVC